MKKHVALIVALILAVTFIISGCSNTVSEPEKPDENISEPEIEEKPETEELQNRLVFASGPSGGGWYLMGVLLGDLWMRELPEMNITVTEGAAIGNIHVVNEGIDGHIGFSYTSDLMDAYNGKEGFTGDSKNNWKALCTLYPTWWQISVLEDTPIYSIADLKGKHIAPSTQGTGAELAMKRILEAAGMSYEDMGKVSYGNYNDSVTLLRDGIVDATMTGGSVSVPALLEADTLDSIRTIPLSEEILKNLDEAGYGYDTSAVIPAGLYSGDKEDVPVISSHITLFVNDDINNETAYQLTKTIWENIEDIRRDEPTRGNMMFLEKAAEGLDKEYFHPGAIRYFEEKGLM